MSTQMPTDQVQQTTSSPRSHNEEALVPRIATGDISAFEELYDLHSATIFGIVLSILKNEQAAEEALQETFLQVWKKAESWSPNRGTEISWLITIARSRAIDTIRKIGTRRDREEESVHQSQLLTVKQSTPFSNASVKEARKTIEAALAEIPKEQSSALKLAFFSDLTHREVAEKLDQPLGTIKTRIKLGLSKLRDNLERLRPGK